MVQLPINMLIQIVLEASIHLIIGSVWALHVHLLFFVFSEPSIEF